MENENAVTASIKEKNNKKAIYIVVLFSVLILGFIGGYVFSNLFGLSQAIVDVIKEDDVNNYLLKYVGINPNNRIGGNVSNNLIESFINDSDNGSSYAVVSFINSYAKEYDLFEKEPYTGKSECDNGENRCYLLSQSNFDMIAKMYSLNYSFSEYALFDDGEIIKHTNNISANSKRIENNNFNTYYLIYKYPLLETGIFTSYQYDDLFWQKLSTNDGETIILKAKRTKKTNLDEILGVDYIEYTFEKEKDGRYYIIHITKENV